MGLLSLLLLLALSGVLGWVAIAAVAPAAPPRRGEPALAIVAGLVALYALLLLFDLAGVPWRRGPLAAGWSAATAAAVAVAWSRRPIGWRWDGRRAGAGGRPGFGRGAIGRGAIGWGDGVAAGAALLYAAAAWTRRITIPDFVYHWGPKAKRALLGGGVDYAFLADPLRLTDHPDYPHLLPGLYAAVGVVRGAFHERAALLVSVVFFALAVAGVRRAAAVAGLPRHPAQGTVAAVALTLAAFGIGYRMAGAADWPVVAALLVALPALVGLPGRGPGRGLAAPDDALRLGLAAALAAGSKIEGVPLAALLVGVGLVRLGGTRWWVGGTARRAAELARLVVPPLLVVVPWTVQNLRHGLFAAENTGPLVAARIPVVVRAAAEVFATAEWAGLPWLLLLLPALLARRATRMAAAVLLLQGGFYAWVYLTSPVDTRFFVLSSLARLLFHLVPPLLVLLAIALFAGRETAPPLTAARPGADGAGEGAAPGRQVRVR